MPYREAPWQPAVDVYRLNSGWLVKFDLAGVPADELDLEVTGNQLRVRGVRRDHLVEEVCQIYSMEISYSRFERTIELPESLSEARMSWEYHDGMLIVRLEKETAP